MKVYQKLAKYVDDNEIEIKYIAKKTGIKEYTLKEILNGKKELGIDEFIEIVLVLGLDANYFINNSNK